mgnify:CR=1 FL=1
MHPRFFDCGRDRIVECPSDIRQFRCEMLSNCRKFRGIRQYRSKLVSNCRIYLTYSTIWSIVRNETIRITRFDFSEANNDCWPELHKSTDRK